MRPLPANATFAPSNHSIESGSKRVNEKNLQGASKEVNSNQEGIHPDLALLVRKHLNSEYRKPIALHTQEAFATAVNWRKEQGFSRPLILDSGCGTGESTWHLAQAYPDHLVIGLDKSALRLAKFPGGTPSNMLLLRADVVDFWMLAEAQHWHLALHTLFYPNPWPKAHHLMRRFHAHPVFPIWLRLGGRFELRTNWRIYAEEFACALTYAGLAECIVAPLVTQEPWTAFERKYRVSGHALWRLQGNLDF